MAASLSRPDPSSPASVAEAAFNTGRRGYQPDEVRAFLVAVAAEMGRLQERERQLEAELRQLREVPQRDELDDETVANLLGEETLRVLQTARESASQIKIRAEDAAARVLREANDEANRLRQEVDVEVARRRQDAASDAEAEVALAKQQGREMVNEARSYRERVLADLERRTTLARHQIEELIHGRDRLLQVFERARLVAVDVTSELKAIDAPEELVNLSPTTGPVPIMVPADRRPDPDPDASVEDDVDVVDDASDEAADDVAEDAVDDDQADASIEEDQAAEAEVDVETAVTDEAEESSKKADTNVVSLFRGRPSASDAAEADDHPSTEPPDAVEAVDDPLDADAAADRLDVGDLFERLRQQSEVEAAEDDDTGDAAADVEPSDPEVSDADASETDDNDRDPTPFSRRDEAIVPLIVAGARRLKRVLADEQNEALDTLRQREPVTSLDDLVPSLDEHTRHYVDGLADELQTAAAVGAAEFGANDTKTLRRKLVKAGALSDAEDQVRSSLVVPLRDRLERAVGDGDGDNDDITRRVRAVYREWKTQHIDDQLDDVFRRAFSGGLAASIEPGTSLVWTVDPARSACPDCEDNSLAGTVAAGDEFPTGHTWAPAHPGCTCLALPES